jgi:hypothetical protein
MYTVAKPWMTTARHVAISVEAVPQVLFSRFLTASRQTVQTVKTHRPRHHSHSMTTPHAARPYVMLVASDITDKW